ncbi:MAG: hypothetical protein IID45_06890 [Planctomycetes bacterium]|nr:hypothetical protein [Planctomycetota bacterium]
MNRVLQLTFAVAAFTCICGCGGTAAEVERALPDTLSVELRAWPKKESIYNRNPVIVRFVNGGNRPIIIFKRLDGSLWSWHMPHYRITVVDAQGRKLKLSPRCGVSGLWANTKWPDDYLVKIAPGKSYELEVGIHHLIREDGEYRVKFEYVYDPDAKQQQTYPIPAGAWKGIARSKEVLLSLRKSL